MTHRESASIKCINESEHTDKCKFYGLEVSQMKRVNHCSQRVLLQKMDQRCKVEKQTNGLGIPATSQESNRGDLQHGTG